MDGTQAFSAFCEDVIDVYEKHDMDALGIYANMTWASALIGRDTTERKRLRHDDGRDDCRATV